MMLLHKGDFTAGFDQKYKALSLCPSPGEGKNGSGAEGELSSQGGRRLG